MDADEELRPGRVRRLDPILERNVHVLGARHDDVDAELLHEPVAESERDREVDVLFHDAGPAHAPRVRPAVARVDRDRAHRLDDGPTGSLRQHLDHLLSREIGRRDFGKRASLEKEHEPARPAPATVRPRRLELDLVALDARFDVEEEVRVVLHLLGADAVEEPLPFRDRELHRIEPSAVDLEPEKPRRLAVDMVEELLGELERRARPRAVVRDADARDVVLGDPDREQESRPVERDLLGRARGEDVRDELEGNHDGAVGVPDGHAEHHGRLVHHDDTGVDREEVAAGADPEHELAVPGVPEFRRLEDAREVERRNEELLALALDPLERHVLGRSPVAVDDAEALRRGGGGGVPRAEARDRAENDERYAGDTLHCSRPASRPKAGARYFLRSRSFISRWRSRSASRSAMARRLSISFLPRARPSSTFTLPASLK